MNPRFIAGIVGILLSACTFDTSGIVARDGGAPVDAPRPDGNAIDAGPCAADILAVLRVDGVADELPPGQPHVHALPGDVVELSAAGSCARAGGLTYEWQISPIDASRSTASPGLDAETLTFYPVLPQDYTITLTVRASDGATATTSVLGVRTYGWQRRELLPGSPDVRGLYAADEDLWIAHARGAHRLVLGGQPSADEFFDIGAEVTGAAIDTDLGAVHYDQSARVLWLGAQGKRSAVWRIDRSQEPPVSTLIDISAPAILGATAEVFDISKYASGLALATDRGMTTSADGVSFDGAFVPAEGADVHAAVDGAGQRFAGGHRLYLMDSGTSFDPFMGAAGADDKLRDLAVDEARRELWVATEGNGVARLDIADPTAPRVIAVYDASNTLPAERALALALETEGAYAGDVWVATTTGVARYIRARDEWLLMGNNHGLQQRLSVQALAIDQAAGRRAIFAGARGGLVSLGAVLTP